MEETYTLGRIEGWRPEPEHVDEGVYVVGGREVGIVGVMNLVDREADYDMTSEVHDDLQAFRNFLRPAGRNGRS